jgi:cytosine/adenosine deaminase-related metal-dependent hydrolase
MARQAGVATSLGLDVPISITLDYFETVRNGYWSIFRTPEGVAHGQQLNSADAIDFATRWGAKALRLGDTVGSVEIGKRADLLLLRTDRLSFAPHGTLADRVLNFASWPDIDSVWIAGKARKQNGKMLGVDMASLRRQQIDAQNRAAELVRTIKLT